MQFEDALKEIKNGKRVTNKNWNGKGMCVFAMPGYIDGVVANPVMCEKLNLAPGTIVEVCPYLMMRNAQGQYVSWIISNMDVFSDKWEVVD